MRKILLSMCIFLLLGALGCNEVSSNQKLGIRGQITKISTDNSGKITAILVEGKIEQDTEVDKASVSIREKTRIHKKDKNEDIGVSELKEGLQVEIIFEGPVRESYPVQADAKLIRVIE